MAVPNATGTRGTATRTGGTDKRKLTAEERDERRRAKKRIRLQQRKEAKRKAERDAGILAGKPLEEWDAEELARGRPRAVDGTFRGVTPKYITRAMHEQAIRMFVDHTNKGLRGLVPQAMQTLQWILETDDFDAKGRPMVPAGVKLEASKWVIEHIVGKARQPVDVDISVKLQGILANVMVQPSQLGGSADPDRDDIEVPALMPSVGVDFVDAEVVEDDEDDSETD